MAKNWSVSDLGLRLEGLVLPVGLELDEATVEGSDVTVSTDPFSILLGKDAAATVRVSCESIAKFLGSLDLGSLRDIQVSTEGVLLKVSGTATVLIPIRATAYCSLVVRDGKLLDVLLDSAEPGAARAVIEKQLSTINPILDLSNLAMNVSITEVEIEDGWVTLRGIAT